MSTAKPQQDSEEAVLRDWLRLLDAARDVRARAERGGFAVPKGLRSLLGEDITGAAAGVHVPPMPAPAGAPIGLKNDWIWVPINHSSTQIRTVIKGILRTVGESMPVKRIIEVMKSLRPSLPVSEGAVANLGTILERDGVISRGAEGWLLTAMDLAPELDPDGGYLYGPVEMVLTEEIAWFRRAAICHVLGQMPGGLQAMQIVEHLAALEWVPGPKGKDIVKMDLEALKDEERVARTAGHSKKWVLQTVEKKSSKG